LLGLTLTLANNSGETNFSETDTCGVNGAPSSGQPFDLVSGQPCVITITFAPLETCALGLPPTECPSPLTATLIVTSPSSDMIIEVPLTGTGVSAGSAITRSIEPVATGILSTSSYGSLSDAERHAEIE
jgi:hypothetical protein